MGLEAAAISPRQPRQQPDAETLGWKLAELMALRRRHAPFGSEEVVGLIGMLNPAVAAFVRDQTAEAVTEHDRMLIAATAWVIYRAADEAVTKVMLEPD